MALPIEAAGVRGVTEPSIARMRDYWLGGQHHREIDRYYAERTVMVAPHMPYQVRTQRALLGRMVRYLVEQGVRQFLDLGSGLPTCGHVHEIAQRLDPSARVVYVDHDPDIAADSRNLLGGNENTAVLEADLRAPGALLASPDLLRLIDLSEPLAVIAIATLQHIPDADQPLAVVAGYRDAMCSGSYLAVSHYGPDASLSNAFELLDSMNFGDWRPKVSLRDLTSIGAFFAGLELVEPGIVPIPLWRPDPEDDLGRNSELAPILAGLARKP